MSLAPNQIPDTPGNFEATAKEAAPGNAAAVMDKVQDTAAVASAVQSLGSQQGSVAGIAGAVAQTAGAANAFSNIGAVQQVADIAGKAQQAAMAAGAIKNLTNSKMNLPGMPGSSGINGNIPFEQLDTPAATEAARARSAAPVADTLATTAASIFSTRIVASVSINGNIINEVLSIQIRQGISEHNELKLRFFHDQVQAPGTMIMDGAEKLLGQVAEVELYEVNGVSGEKLQNLFVIADVRLEQDALNEGVLEVIGYAPTWLLDGAPHFETFYKKNLSTIVKDSASQSLSQVKASLKADPTITDTIPFVCRYNESVWNFLKRLSSETGQWLYFNGKELVFGKPEAQTGATIAYGQNCTKINMSLRAESVQQSLFDYEADGNRPINASTSEYSGNAGAYNKIAFDKSKELFGTTLASRNQYFLPAKQATLEAIGKSKSGQSAAGMYYVSGETTLHGLRIGINANVDLKRMGQTANHAPVRITSIEHYWDITGKYHNKFEGIPAAADAPPLFPYQPPVTFPMLAEVIDNKDPKGRVRVKFMGWQQKGIAETDFIRIQTPDGGNSDPVPKNRGLVFIPEVGDQVYVDFEAGNPDRPFVTGSVFHGMNGMGGGTDNNIKSITMKNGSTITFDESKKSITISDPSQNVIVMDGDGTINMSSPKAINISSKDISITASNNITINATSNITQGAQAIGITATDGLAMKGSATSLDGTATLNLESPDLKAHGDTTGISGTTITVSGNGDVGITGGLVKINS